MVLDYRSTARRLMDSLITLTARAAVVEAAEVTWQTLQAGMVQEGRVHGVDDHGATIQVHTAAARTFPNQLYARLRK